MFKKRKEICPSGQIPEINLGQFTYTTTVNSYKKGSFANWNLEAKITSGRESSYP